MIYGSDYLWDVAPSGQSDDGLHIPSAKRDAFDGYGGLAVSSNAGMSYAPYSNPLVNGCMIEDGGREVVFPADTTSVPGIGIDRKVFVSASAPAFARWVEALTNTGAAPVTLRARWGGNLGTDANTTVLSSSNGDLSLSAADRWAATVAMKTCRSPTCGQRPGRRRRQCRRRRRARHLKPGFGSSPGELSAETAT